MIDTFKIPCKSYLRRQTKAFFKCLKFLIQAENYKYKIFQTCTNLLTPLYLRRILQYKQCLYNIF